MYMKNVKKALSLVLIAAFCFSLLLTGCGNKAEVQTTGANDTTGAVTAGTTAEVTAEPLNLM